MIGGDLSLNQLRAFYVAASCGSITLAAEKLYITQPAVSMQIKALENQFEVTLFLRTRKKLELTEPGKRLYQIAKKIFGLVAQAERLLNQSHEFATHVLRIGSTKTLVRYILAPFISKFQESFPRIRIQIDEGSSEEMARSVVADHNDLAIVGRVPYDDKLEVIPYAQYEVALLAAPDHPICQKKQVWLDDLKDETLILREQGSGTRLLVERIFEKAAIAPSSFIQSGNVDFIKELVGLGRGITLLARMGADHDVSEGRLKILPLVEGPFALDCDIVINKERPLSNAVEAFLNLLLAERKSFPGYEGSSIVQAIPVRYANRLTEEFDSRPEVASHVPL
jgi:DNA-binding transcriptional LysR family regulator